MEMPNIYKGNYKLLILIPLFLVAASLALIFIPGSPYAIQKGVDFKGGTLVTMQTSAGVNEEQLKSALVAQGFPVSSVKSLSNPKGYEVEVEVERDENLTRAEDLKTSFYAKIDEVSRLEADAAASNQSADSLAKYAEGRKSVDSDANALFAIAGLPQNASSYASTNALKNEAGLVYRKILNDNSERLSAALAGLVHYESASFNEVSASLSAKFLDKALMVVIYSTIIVSIVVFIIFRTVVPSIAVLTGAACDVIIAMGAMGLFGIPLTLASFAALLMLVGFSLDTDVLLTMRVIKRKEGTPRERAYDAMKTGMTMSMALLLSFVCLFILASVTHINTYYEISAVAIAGLVGDVIATWMFNAVIVLWYLEHGGKTGEEQKPFLSTVFSS
ncbi:Protein-export membrane protein SecF [uncultured archaeon]|nr:Protein-export membrane protein SecF [uncultured archaeon]